MESVWQDASFRGAKFFVESFDRKGGRRGPDHEFPRKDEGYPEDTGKKMEGFTIEAYTAKSVQDPDYASRRDALIEALNKKGPGELNHPAFGSVQVQVREWSEQESKTQLGLGAFSLRFVEASKAQYPTSQQSPAAKMPGLGSSAHGAAANSFGQNFSAAGQGDFITGAAAGAFGQTADCFSMAAGLAGISIDAPGLLENLVDTFWDATRTRDESEIPDAVAAFPRAITGHFEDKHKATRNADGTYRGLSRLRGNGPLEPEAATSLFRIFDYQSGMTAPVLQTTTRLREYQNAEAVAALVRRTAIIESARVGPFINWRTLDEAETARDRITDALDREAWDAYDDGIYRTFAAMRSLLVVTMSPDNGRLPFLMDYTPAVTQPSLALSHRIYGTANNADELAIINGLRHPGFFPGGVPIRILANAQ